MTGKPVRKQGLEWVGASVVGSSETLSGQEGGCVLQVRSATEGTDRTGQMLTLVGTREVKGSCGFLSM